MVKSEAGSAGRAFVVVLLVLAVLTLATAVVYLLSDLNHRNYRIATHESNLVIEQGRFFPVGFKRFEPSTDDLKASYAPIPLPPNVSIGRTEVFNDRADLDRAVFVLLASWARERLDSREPGDFELATSYISRCELLPGLSEEQRIEMKTLRADLAFKNGRRILGEVVNQLKKALGEFETAYKLGTSRPQDVDQWIADVQRRIRDYQNAGVSIAQPEAPPEPGLETPPDTPNVEQPVTPQDDDTNPPKWRL
ncbi:MAG: hypothetical protein A2289_22835 [Deltaproteobacteria bacterium RIFOXYA12_FULL_58_15]|nr:MAG: hypothetical protein A2289_22835 [Deltaproteobacteria bacterium RIFOXYA12_FULL_58_15]OGR10007.1 MAG: hypothetical protein A2341_05470 [Deltaproteobacteria bacterium RIFOXYB12_FULL_58_9]